MRSPDLKAFVLFIFVLGILAPACDFLWGGNLSVIEICTSNGIERQVVPADDNQSPADQKAKADQCPYCFQGTNLAFLNTAPVIINPVSWQKPVSWSFITQSHYIKTSGKDLWPRAPPPMV